jgi:hypothetical protein
LGRHTRPGSRPPRRRAHSAAGCCRRRHTRRSGPCRHRDTARWWRMPWSAAAGPGGNAETIQQLKSPVTPWWHHFGATARPVAPPKMMCRQQDDAQVAPSLLSCPAAITPSAASQPTIITPGTARFSASKRAAKSNFARKIVHLRMQFWNALGLFSAHNSALS